jgi:hypothetical protein
MGPFGVSDLSAEEIAEAFGNMGRFATRKLYCETLQKVRLYGITLQ